MIWAFDPDDTGTLVDGDHRLPCVATMDPDRVRLRLAAMLHSRPNLRDATPAALHRAVCACGGPVAWSLFQVEPKQNRR